MYFVMYLPTVSSQFATKNEMWVKFLLDFSHSAIKNILETAEMLENNFHRKQTSINIFFSGNLFV